MTYLAYNPKYTISSKLSEEEAKECAKQFGSVLYLCSDEGEDVGIEDQDFSYLQNLFAFEDKACEKIAMRGNSLEFQEPSALDTDQIAITRKLGQLRFYTQIERVLNQLSHAYDNAALPKDLRAEKSATSSAPIKPSILILCKSNRRAGLVVDLFTGVQQGLSYEELEAKTILSYHGSPGFVHFVRSVLDTMKSQRKPHTSRYIYRQLMEKESSTFTYLIGDPVSKECLLIDPCIDKLDRDEAYIRELGLKLKYVVNTHVHADHVSGSGLLKKRFADDDCKSVISKASGALADIILEPYDILLLGMDDTTDIPDLFASESSGHESKEGAASPIGIIGLPTPGHTSGCYSFLMTDFSRVFTGDALLVRGCGRTDFQQGNSELLYRSVHDELFTLPDHTYVCPAHDYKGFNESTIGEERVMNPRLGNAKTVDEFRSIMSNLNLQRPGKIDVAVPLNLVCGLQDKL